MIRSNQELYDRVQRLAAELRATGHSAAADRLASALTISTVAGEVLGELRVVVGVLESTQDLSEPLRGEVQAAARYLDRVLQA